MFSAFATRVPHLSVVVLGLALFGACSDDKGSTAPRVVPPPRTGSRFSLDIPRINAAWNVDSTHVVMVEGSRDLRWSVRRNGTAGEAQVSVVARPGTAAEEADYAQVSALAWFANGSATSSEWTGLGWPGLHVRNDNLVEPDEDLVLALADPDSGWALDPVRDRIFVTIVDNDDVPPIAASFAWPMEVGEPSRYEVSGGGWASDGFPGGFVVHGTGSISIPAQREFKGKVYSVYQGLTGDVLVRQDGSRIYVVPRGSLGDPPPVDDPAGRRLWERMPWLWFDAADPSLPCTASFADSSTRDPFSYSVVNRGTTRIAIPSGIYRVQCLELGWTRTQWLYEGEGIQRWYVADSIGVVALDDERSEHHWTAGITGTHSTAVLVDSPRLLAHGGDRR